VALEREGRSQVTEASDSRPASTGSGSADGGRRARHRNAVAERIIAAARDALLERTDADSLSLRDVARRADFTPGALYRYFDSREALLAGLFNEALDLLASYVDPALQGERGVPRLRRMGFAYLAFGREHPQDLALIFQSAAHVPTWEEYVALARPFSSLVAALREDVEAGLLLLPADLDEPGLAYALWALLHGMAELRRAHLRLVAGEFDAMQRAALEHFLAPLVPAGGQPKRAASEQAAKESS
jgi:AcrR family transcriptional regulator